MARRRSVCVFELRASWSRDRRHMKRNLFIGSTLAALLLALGLGQGILEKKARRAGQGQQDHGPALRSRSDLPEAAAQPLVSGHVDRRRRRRQRSRLDRPSSRHASTRSRRRKTRRPARAARRRRRFSSSTRTARCCATGAARTATAISGPARTTASPSTTRATSGSAATASGDGMVLKFTQDGKFLMQVGKKGVPIDSNSTGALRHGRQDLRSTRRRTRPTSPTATATSASS